MGVRRPRPVFPVGKRGAGEKRETESMVERFTEHVRRTVFFARYEASPAGSAYVEPQHLLLAPLREAKPLFGLWPLDGPEAVRSIRAEVETAFHIDTGHLQLGLPREENAPGAASIPQGPGAAASRGSPEDRGGVGPFMRI
jgi:hypothetical protein